MKRYLAMADDVLSGAMVTPEACLGILEARGAAFSEVLAGAHRIREATFGDGVELCSIINAKSGRCGEDCAFCAQSAHHRTDAPVYGLKSSEEILAAARQAAEDGSHCFGIVTSGGRLKGDAEWDTVLGALREIRRMGARAEDESVADAERPGSVCPGAEWRGMDPAASLGILDARRARDLAEAGCVTYHHNLETARSFFPSICSTHGYDEDVETVRLAKAAGLRVCCGGILGLGESLAQRVELAMTLRDLQVDSVPLNFLVPVEGTPLGGQWRLTPMDCLRSIAMFRYVLPGTRISVCGGRGPNLRELQSWIFMAGASGTMVGNYLTTRGRDRETDLEMIANAGYRIVTA